MLRVIILHLLILLTIYFVTYHRGLSILTQINYLSLKFGHVSCSHSQRPICVPCGIYSPTQIKMKERALYGNMKK